MTLWTIYILRIIIYMLLGWTLDARVIRLGN
jgi:hypothetical protein